MKYLCGSFQRKLGLVSLMVLTTQWVFPDVKAMDLPENPVTPAKPGSSRPQKVVGRPTNDLPRKEILKQSNPLNVSLAAEDQHIAALIRDNFPHFLGCILSAYYRRDYEAPDEENDFQNPHFRQDYNTWLKRAISRVIKHRLISKDWQSKVDSWVEIQPNRFYIPLSFSENLDKDRLLTSEIGSYLCKSNFEMEVQWIGYTNQTIAQLIESMKNLKQAPISSLIWSAGRRPLQYTIEDFSSLLNITNKPFKFNHLRSLEFSRVTLCEKTARELGKFIAKCENLEILSLSTPGGACDPIADFLKDHKKLKSFSLMSTDLDSPQIQKFITNLPKDIEVLDLIGNPKIDYDVCLSLYNKLPDTPNLQLLRLAISDEGSAGARIYAEKNDILVPTNLNKNGFFYTGCGTLTYYEKTVSFLINKHGLSIWSYVRNEEKMDFDTQTLVAALINEARRTHPKLKFCIHIPPRKTD